jgi:hypothetical protein
MLFQAIAEHPGVVLVVVDDENAVLHAIGGSFGARRSTDVHAEVSALRPNLKMRRTQGFASVAESLRLKRVLNKVGVPGCERRHARCKAA